MCQQITGDGQVLALDIHTGTTRWSAQVGGFDSMSSAAVVGNMIYVGFGDSNYLHALNAGTGQLAWQTKLGRGSSPPAYKAGITMIHNCVVYVGSPATSTFYALRESDGTVLSKLTIPGTGPAGAGRGGAAFYHRLARSWTKAVRHQPC